MLFDLIPGKKLSNNIKWLLDWWLSKATEMGLAACTALENLLLEPHYGKAQRTR